MKPSQRDRLLDILDIQSHTGQTSRMRAHMRRQLEEAGMTVVKRHRQLFARKGRSDGTVPIFVAHSDTVHKIVSPEDYALGMYTDKGDVVYHAFSPRTRKWTGVGGDDKCGLWVALEAAHALSDVGVIITIDEEAGCKGARLLTEEDSAHASILIQADRRGNDDAVRRTYHGELSGGDWQDHVKDAVLAHGYDWCNFGAGTDVAAMKRSVSAVNLSAGYYDPHSASETIREGDLENCLELALSLALKSSTQVWEHDAKKRENSNNRRPYRNTAWGMKDGAREWVPEYGLWYYSELGQYAISLSNCYYYYPESVVGAMGDTELEVRTWIDLERARAVASYRVADGYKTFLQRFVQNAWAKRCDVASCSVDGTVDEDTCMVLCDRHMAFWKERLPVVEFAKQVAIGMGTMDDPDEVKKSHQSALALPYG